MKATEEQSPTSYSAAPTSPTSEFLPIAKQLVVLLIVVVFLRSSVVEAFRIPSQSMEPTLLVGDHILVNKLSYGFRLPLMAQSLWMWSAPKRGDIVVFTRPDDVATLNEDESATILIKRVIGLPGDKIEVRGAEVLINDHVYEEDAKYARWIAGGASDFGPVTVPDGTVLLLGDNRDQSKDSRFWEDSPFLNIRRIKGRAFIIYWNSGFLFDRMFNILR